MRPEEDYLLAVGWAHYVFLYLEWEVIYVLHHITGTEVASLTADSPRGLFRKLEKNWTDDPEYPNLVERYNDIVTRREHLAHSHPATHPGGAQRLHRYNIKRDKDSTVMFIEKDWLEKFARDALALNREFNSFRVALRPGQPERPV